MMEGLKFHREEGRKVMLLKLWKGYRQRHLKLGLWKLYVTTTTTMMTTATIILVITLIKNRVVNHMVLVTVT